MAFYRDVFNLEKLDGGEGDAFFKLGEHQFLAMFEVKDVKPDQGRHFGLMVRDEQQIAEIRQKLTKKYGIELIPPFAVTFGTRGATAFRSSTCMTSPWCGCCLTRRCRRPELSLRTDRPISVTIVFVAFQI